MKRIFRVFLYLFLMAVFLIVVWLIGTGSQGFAGIFAFILVALAGAGLILSRHQCLILGGTGLIAGIAGPAILWTIEAMAQGDTSAYGMFGTILFILFAPIGIGVTIIGILKPKNGCA